MSDNSLESLLAWLKDTSRMLDWGLIFGLDRQKSNLLIRQEYNNRFNTGSTIKPISGDVELVEGKYVERVQNFVLSVPLLLFDNTKLNDSKARLIMKVMGGDQITLARTGDGWNTSKVQWIDPLEGPELTLMLLLAEVPGEISKEGRVRLDLKHSDEFILNFSETAHGRRLGGEFFKDYFNSLPDEQRIYPLGEIKRGNNVLLDPESFVLRTQAISPAAWDRSSNDYGEGCILVLVRTLARYGGNFPGEDYRYLLPEKGGERYSASVLFDRRRAAGDTLLSEVQRLFNGEGFDYTFDDNGDLVNAALKSGGLEVPAKGGVVALPLIPLIIWKISKMNFPAVSNKAFVVSVLSDRLVVDWTSEGVTRIDLTAVGHEGHSLDQPVITELHAEYELEERGGVVVLVQTLLEHNTELGESIRVTPVGEPENEFWDAVMLALVLAAILAEGIIESLKKNIEAAFKEVLQTDASINEYLQETIRLNFGNAIQGTEFYAPSDVLHVAHINRTQTAFEIAPMDALVRQGTTLQFATVSAAQGVQWKVENVEGETGSAGTISPTGLYTAPDIDKRYKHVRVTATDNSGQFSVALVNVLRNELNVNPRIQICDVGKSVEMKAGSLGTGARQWKIKNPVAGQSGTVRPSDNPDGDHTYDHGPVVPQKTFLLEEIEVTVANGPAQSVHVLALQKAPALTLNIASFDAVAGRVQLEAIFNGNVLAVEWQLVLGPGQLDANGLYTGPAEATDSYVLIFAIYDGGPLGLFEGYLILPLPLKEFPAVLARLTR